MKIHYLTGILALIFILSGIFLKESGLIYDSYNAKKNIAEIEDNLEDQLKQAEAQTLRIVNKIKSNSNVRFVDLSIDSYYPYYVYKSSRLFFWSDFRFVPDYEQISNEEEIKYITTENGNYVVRKWEIENPDKFEIYTLIPIYYEPEIRNQYLEIRLNPDIFNYTDIRPLPQRLDGQEVILRDKFIFSVETTTEYNVFNRPFQILAFSLFLTGLVMITSFILRTIKILSARKKFELSFLILLSSLFLIRVTMLYSEFPNAYGEFLIFDSKLFASSDIYPSIGDVLLNTLFILAVVIYLFQVYHKSSLFIRLLKLNVWEKIFIATILVTGCFISLYYHYFLFRSIYNNSQWSLDIMHSLEFNFPKIIFYLIFILNSIIFFLTYHILFRIISKLTHRSFLHTLLSYSLGGLLLILFAYNLEIPLVFFIILNLVYFFLLFLLKLPRFLIQLRYFAFLYLFISAIASAIIGAYSIYNFEERNTFNNKVRFADQFLVENDYLAESLLAEAALKIQDDPLITSRIYSPFLSKETVAQKIKRFYLGSYFDKYNIEIYIYNAEGIPYETGSTIARFDVIRSTFGIDQYATDFPNLYFVNRVGADVTKRYFYFLDIERYGNIIGRVIIDLSLKKIIPETVYPELLVDSRFFVPYENTDYSYAVFTNSQITYTSGEYNFNSSFDKDLLNEPTLFSTGLITGGYQHFAVVDSDKRTIVISNPTYSIFKFVSNFSFLFLILVVVIIMIVGINAGYNSFSKINLKYATKIQLYLNLAFIIPLFVVSIATLSLINQSFKSELEAEHYQMAQNLARDVIDDIERYNALVIDREQLTNNFSQVSKIANTDANLFNIRGRLIATSQPAIYDNKLLSEYINPEALVVLREQGNNRTILQESVGYLKFNSSYIAVKSSETGEIIAFLSTPFFDSEYILERQQIVVLANIMNIFTAIFLIFLGVSYGASKRLTFPLQAITQKIQKITLGSENEPLQWNAEDEIGLMVTEYNKMIANLERSKNALALSEKEAAWREMAQQVAHEIKNPLTPMKLTLQQLERTMIENGDSKGEFKKSIKTLLYQIETLNEIAGSFSTFAQMPIPTSQSYDICDLMRRTFGLHTNIEKGNLTVEVPKDKVLVTGDEKMMSRILSNIIINSMQSIPPEREPIISGSVTVNGDGKVLLSITDNGKGIPDSIRDKVFVPRFSTKSRGSGIGLAIAKHGIEHTGGKIWFETETDVGTTFYIELLMPS